MNRLNNKGQSLVIFIIFLPMFIMIGTLVIDIGLAKYTSRRLDNITKSVTKYGLKHIDNDPYNNMVDLIYQNDDKIDSYDIKINLETKEVEVSILKATKGFFGSVVGKDIYSEKSSYIGYIKNEKIVIEKKGN